MKKIIKLYQGNAILIGIVLSVSVFVGCKKNNVSANPGANELFMQSSKFNPSAKTISRGTTITWINKDSYNHTVTSSTSGIFDSGQLGQNKTFSYTFATAGTFAYYCADHSGMTGTITVQ